MPSPPCRGPAAPPIPSVDAGARYDVDDALEITHLVEDLDPVIPTITDVHQPVVATDNAMRMATIARGESPAGIGLRIVDRSRDVAPLPQPRSRWHRTRRHGGCRSRRRCRRCRADVSPDPDSDRPRRWQARSAASWLRFASGLAPELPQVPPGEGTGGTALGLVGLSHTPLVPICSSCVEPSCVHFSTMPSPLPAIQMLSW